MKLVVRSKAPSEHIKKWTRKHPLRSHYSVMVDGNVEVYGPTGKPIIILKKNIIPKIIIDSCYPAFDYMKKFTSDNRSLYAGAKHTGPVLKKDGTRSKINRALDENGKPVQVTSTIAGYFEAQGGRLPYCRKSLITRTQPEKWKETLPLYQFCAKIYKKNVPIRYEKQMEYIRKTNPAWVIPDTPFTTVTINNSVAAAYHQDAGDLKDGMGMMAVLSKGEYKGFELVIPEYNFAVNVEHGDVLIFDPTIWHGNIPPYDTVGERNKDWQRISIVMYYREGILGCKSPEEELARLKKKGEF